MKKTFKSFATIMLMGASIFTGINTIENIDSKTSNSINAVQEKSTKSNSYIYNLAPDEEFNPNDSKFDSSWGNLLHYHGSSYMSLWRSALLIAIEDIAITKDNYQIKFDYAIKNVNHSGWYDVRLNLYNESNTFENSLDLDSITTLNYNNTLNDRKSATIEVPKWALDNQKLFFDTKFYLTSDPHHWYKNQYHYKFDLNTYPYLHDFYVNSFAVLNDSITNEGFEFLTDIKLDDENSLNRNAFGLVLYSNGMPLLTEFVEYQGNLLKYKVSNLHNDSVYNNFSIGIYGYKNIKSIDGLVIKTKAKAATNPNAGIIAGSTIGGIILLLLILLIILLLLKRRKKVVEYNYYHNYRTFVDQQGNYIEMNQEEYDALEEDVAAQYEEVDTSELLDGHYEYQ